MPERGSWLQYEKLVLHTVEKHDEQIEQLRDKLSAVELELATTRRNRARMAVGIPAISGAVVTIIEFLIRIFG